LATEAGQPAGRGGGGPEGVQPGGRRPDGLAQTEASALLYELDAVKKLLRPRRQDDETTTVDSRGSRTAALRKFGATVLVAGVGRTETVGDAALGLARGYQRMR
jgi:hypothetical protein